MASTIRLSQQHSCSFDHLVRAGGVRVQHGEEWGKKQGNASAEGHRDANG